MTIQELGSVGEFVGGFLVLASLVYLALQTKQNARIGYWTMYQSQVNGYSTFATDVAKDEGLREAWFKAWNATPEELSDTEWKQVTVLVQAWIFQAESGYSYNTEFGQKEANERWARILRNMGDSPVMVQLWDELRGSSTASFQKFVDATIKDT